jgi:hypothetical protein
VHGNRQVPAVIPNTEELKELWASPRTKDALRRQNVRAELAIADKKNTGALEQHLLEADTEEPPLLQDTAPKGPSQNQSQDQDVAPQQTQSGSKLRFILCIPVKRTHELAAMVEALKCPRT